MRNRRTSFSLPLFLLLLSVACAGARQAPTLPAFEPLPSVQWVQDGENACLTPEEAVKMAQREKLRGIREEAYIALLKAKGYVSPADISEAEDLARGERDLAEMKQITDSAIGGLR